MEPTQIPTEAESPFGFDELFFSRTDTGSIILAGNEVFQRVSHYSWDELLNKPHKVIRHPDMPRAVFWLLWNTIKQNEPIGAYVKNRAKNGAHYWVYAIVTPITGGFLSVRLKPSSALFGVVQKEYAALAEAERRDNLKPADSAKMLLDRLAALGFPDYGAFMSAALNEEIAARNEKLARANTATHANFEELLQSAQSLLTKANEISTAYEKNQYVPLNFQVQAAQLGARGETIVVISNNYNVLSDNIRQNLKQFIETANHVVKSIQQGQFLADTAQIQREVLTVFRAEKTGDGEALAKEIERLDGQRSAYECKSIAGLDAISVQAERFTQACAEMGRLAAGLEVTRIMGKVESSRLDDAGSGLNELTDELEVFQKSVAAGLKGIGVMNRRIEEKTRNLRVTAARAA